MGSAAQTEHELFGGAPFLRLLRRFRLLPSEGSQLTRRALMAVLVAWVPLVLLSVLEGTALRSRDDDSLLLDLAVHTRYLLALPLFAFAEWLLAARLSGVVHHFRDVGAIRTADLPRFESIVSSTRQLANSATAELVAVVLAYAVISALLFSSPARGLPAWHVAESGGLSLTGWWHALISLPLLLVAVIEMLWRWCLWGRFLWFVSRMDLALVPAHPDGVAGLQFVGYSVRAYVPYGMLVGLIVAGSLANRVLYDNISPLAYSNVVVALLAFVAALFTAPLLFFTRTLLNAWRRGIFDYDALASRMGRQFEAQWFGQGDNVDASALGRPDFSATTDLYSVVANVFRMRLFLFDLQGLVLLACATAVPFVPVVLFAVPIDTILARIASILL